MAAGELIDTSLYIDANLQAYYRFNSGAITTDSKGGNTLTNTNSVGETASGKFGYAADFGNPNTNKYLSINSSPGLTTYNDTFSVVFWVKQAAEISADYVVPWMMQEQTDSTHRTINYINYQYNGGTRRIAFGRYAAGGVGAGQNEDTYNINLGTDWNHLAFVYNGTNIKGYLNGALVKTIVTTDIYGTSYTPILYVGGDATVYWSGVIDDFALFDRELSSQEIEDLYDGDSVTTTSSSTSTSTSTSSSTSSTSSSTSTSTSISTSTSSTSTSTTTTTSTSSSTTTTLYTGTVDYNPKIYNIESEKADIDKIIYRTNE